MRWYWIDRFLEFESGRSAKAVKLISMAEDHMHDHFPGCPIMPNSLVVEGMAQTGGLLVCEHTGFEAKVVLAKIPKVQFHLNVSPGDTLTYSAEIDHVDDNGAMVTATSHHGDRLQAETEFIFAHLNSGQRDRTLFEPETFLKMMRMLGAFEVGRSADGSPLVAPPLLTGKGS